LPRRRSGSSAENNSETAPLGHARREDARAYRGRSSRGQIAINPDSPSTMISRTSSCVAPIRLTMAKVLIHSRTASAPARVLPAPRPARISQ
jgi:hypothetical protein